MLIFLKKRQNNNPISSRFERASLKTEMYERNVFRRDRVNSRQKVNQMKIHAPHKVWSEFFCFHTFQKPFG